MPTYYVSDTHFDHANIINFCERPFGSVAEMNAKMLEEILKVDAAGHRLIHGGDLAFGNRQTGWLATMPSLLNAGKNLFVVGNHDHKLSDSVVRAFYRKWFATQVGTQATWMSNFAIVDDVLRGRAVRVLVSHQPQHDLHGCEFNLYGHVHNNLLRGSDRDDLPRWVMHSDRHFNICVEVLGYAPRVLEEVMARNRAVASLMGSSHDQEAGIPPKVVGA